MAGWIYTLVGNSGKSKPSAVFSDKHSALRDALQKMPRNVALGIMLHSANGKTSLYSVAEARNAIKTAPKSRQSRASNPLPPDIVLRHPDGEVIATVGDDNRGNRFLVLKAKGDRRPFFDQVLPLAAIIEKLDGLGFDTARLAPRKRATNPVPRGKRAAIKQAANLFENFRDHSPESLDKVEQPDLSAVMVVGECDAIEYTTVRGEKKRVERYRHKFHKHAKPLLCVTGDGKTFLSVGGDFTFTERGFVDKGE